MQSDEMPRNLMKFYEIPWGHCERWTFGSFSLSHVTRVRAMYQVELVETNSIWSTTSEHRTSGTRPAAPKPKCLSPTRRLFSSCNGYHRQTVTVRVQHLVHELSYPSLCVATLSHSLRETLGGLQREGCTCRTLYRKAGKKPQ